MSRIGEMEFKVTDDGRQYFVGVLSVAGYKGKFYLMPNTDKHSDKSPDWLFCEPKVPGSDFRAEFGRADEREGKDTGRRYLSCFFKGPSFENPLGDVRCFARDKQDGREAEMWDLIYQRSDPSKGQGAGQGGGAGSAGGDDEIPF